MSNIEEIRARHEDTSGGWMHGYYDIDDGEQAHADRATLLRALDVMAEENARLAGLIRVLLENEPDDAVSDGGHTVLDLWRHDARAALKEPGVRLVHAGGAPAQLIDGIPPDLAALIASIGKAEWGSTHDHTAIGHALHVRKSVKITAKNFKQTGKQQMHGLFIEGTETVICHTGTSPNSPQIARALTDAWNRLVDLSRAAQAPKETP